MPADIELWLRNWEDEEEERRRKLGLASLPQLGPDPWVTRVTSKASRTYRPEPGQQRVSLALRGPEPTSLFRQVNNVASKLETERRRRGGFGNFTKMRQMLGDDTITARMVTISSAFKRYMPQFYSAENVEDLMLSSWSTKQIEEMIKIAAQRIYDPKGGLRDPARFANMKRTYDPVTDNLAYDWEDIQPFLMQNANGVGYGSDFVAMLRDTAKADEERNVDPSKSWAWLLAKSMGHLFETEGSQPYLEKWSIERDREALERGYEVYLDFLKRGGKPEEWQTAMRAIALRPDWQKALPGLTPPGIRTPEGSPVTVGGKELQYATELLPPEMAVAFGRYDIQPRPDSPIPYIYEVGIAPGPDMPWAEMAVYLLPWGSAVGWAGKGIAWAARLAKAGKAVSAAETAFKAIPGVVRAGEAVSPVARMLAGKAGSLREAAWASRTGQELAYTAGKAKAAKAQIWNPVTKLWESYPGIKVTVEPVKRMAVSTVTLEGQPVLMEGPGILRATTKIATTGVNMWRGFGLLAPTIQATSMWQQQQITRQMDWEETEAERKYQRQKEHAVSVTGVYGPFTQWYPPWVEELVKEDPLYAQSMEFYNHMLDLDPAGVKEAQVILQSQGVGTELEATGVWTADWQMAVINSSDAYAAERIRFRRMLKEMDFEGADKLEINANPMDPAWRIVETEWERYLAELEGMAFEHPERFVALKAAGLPTNPYEWKMLWERIKSHGWPLTPISAAMTGLQLFAGYTYMLPWALAEIAVRKSNNPELQKKKAALDAYVMEAPYIPPKETPFYSKPSYPMDAYIEQQVVQGNLANDPFAQKLWKEYQTELARTISAVDFGGDYMATAIHAVGIDYAKANQFLEENWQQIYAVNLVADLAISMWNPFGKMRRVGLNMRVPRVYQAFVSDARALKTVARMAKSAAQGKISVAAGLAGPGSNIMDSVLNPTIRFGKNGRIHSKAGVVREASGEGLEKAIAGDTEGVAQTFNQNGAFAQDVVKKVNSTYIAKPGEAGGTWWAHTPKVKGVTREQHIYNFADKSVLPLDDLVNENTKLQAIYRVSPVRYRDRMLQIVREGGLDRRLTVVYDSSTGEYRWKSWQDAMDAAICRIDLGHRGIPLAFEFVEGTPTAPPRNAKGLPFMLDRERTTSRLRDRYEPIFAGDEAGTKVFLADVRRVVSGNMNFETFIRKLQQYQDNKVLAEAAPAPAAPAGRARKAAAPKKTEPITPEEVDEVIARADAHVSEAEKPKTEMPVFRFISKAKLAEADAGEVTIPYGITKAGKPKRKYREKAGELFKGNDGRTYVITKNDDAAISFRLAADKDKAAAAKKKPAAAKKKPETRAERQEKREASKAAKDEFLSDAAMGIRAYEQVKAEKGKVTTEDVAARLIDPKGEFGMDDTRATKVLVELITSGVLKPAGEGTETKTRKRAKAAEQWNWRDLTVESAEKVRQAIGDKLYKQLLAVKKMAPTSQDVPRYALANLFQLLMTGQASGPSREALGMVGTILESKGKKNTREYIRKRITESSGTLEIEGKPLWEQPGAKQLGITTPEQVIELVEDFIFQPEAEMKVSDIPSPGPRPKLKVKPAQARAILRSIGVPDGQIEHILAGDELGTPGVTWEAIPMERRAPQVDPQFKVDRIATRLVEDESMWNDILLPDEVPGVRKAVQQASKGLTTIGALKEAIGKVLDKKLGKGVDPVARTAVAFGGDLAIHGPHQEAVSRYMTLHTVSRALVAHGGRFTRQQLFDTLKSIPGFDQLTPPQLSTQVDYILNKATEGATPLVKSDGVEQRAAAFNLILAGIAPQDRTEGLPEAVRPLLLSTEDIARMEPDTIVTNLLGGIRSGTIPIDFVRKDRGLAWAEKLAESEAATARKYHPEDPEGWAKQAYEDVMLEWLIEVAKLATPTMVDTEQVLYRPRNPWEGKANSYEAAITRPAGLLDTRNRVVKSAANTALEVEVLGKAREAVDNYLAKQIEDLSAVISDVRQLQPYKLAEAYDDIFAAADDVLEEKKDLNRASQVYEQARKTLAQGGGHGMLKPDEAGPETRGRYQEFPGTETTLFHSAGDWLSDYLEEAWADKRLPRLHDLVNTAARVEDRSQKEVLPVLAAAAVARWRRDPLAFAAEASKVYGLESPDLSSLLQRMTQHIAGGYLELDREVTDAIQAGTLGGDDVVGPIFTAIGHIADLHGSAQSEYQHMPPPVVRIEDVSVGRQEGFQAEYAAVSLPKAMNLIVGDWEGEYDLSPESPYGQGAYGIPYEQHLQSLGSEYSNIVSRLYGQATGQHFISRIDEDGVPYLDTEGQRVPDADTQERTKLFIAGALGDEAEEMLFAATTYLTYALDHLSRKQPPEEVWEGIQYAADVVRTLYEYDGARLPITSVDFSLRFPGNEDSAIAEAYSRAMTDGRSGIVSFATVEPPYEVAGRVFDVEDAREVLFFGGMGIIMDKDVIRALKEAGLEAAASLPGSIKAAVKGLSEAKSPNDVRRVASQMVRDEMRHTNELYGTEHIRPTEAEFATQVEASRRVKRAVGSKEKTEAGLTKKKQQLEARIAEAEVVQKSREAELVKVKSWLDDNVAERIFGAENAVVAIKEYVGLEAEAALKLLKWMRSSQHSIEPVKGKENAFKVKEGKTELVTATLVSYWAGDGMRQAQKDLKALEDEVAKAATEGEEAIAKAREAVIADKEKVYAGYEATLARLGERFPGEDLTQPKARTAKLQEMMKSEEAKLLVERTAQALASLVPDAAKATPQKVQETTPRKSKQKKASQREILDAEAETAWLRSQWVPAEPPVAPGFLGPIPKDKTSGRIDEFLTVERDQAPPMRTKEQLQSDIQLMVSEQHRPNNQLISEQRVYNQLLDRSARAYAADEQVFPQLAEPQRTRFTAAHAAAILLVDRIGDIENPWVRTFLSEGVKFFSHAPMPAVAFRTWNERTRLFDMALAASNDVRWANEWVTRALMASTDLRRKQLNRELNAMASRNYVIEGFGNYSDFERSLARFNKRIWSWGRDTAQTTAYYGPEAWVDMDLANLAVAPRPGVSIDETKKQRNIGTFQTMDSEGKAGGYAQALPDDVYQRYLWRFHSGVIYAPHAMPVDAKGFAKGYWKVRQAGSAIYTPTVSILDAFTARLRRLSVAVGGAQLFMKHSITDSLRTVVNEGETIIKMHGSLNKMTDAIIETLDPMARDYVENVMYRAKVNEIMYYTGNAYTNFRARTVWRESKEGEWKFTDLDESAAALRRIASGTAFQVWSEAGMKSGKWDSMNAMTGLRDWLQNGTADNPSAGREFLRRTNNVTKTQAEYRAASIQQSGSTGKVKSLRGDALYRQAEADYLRDFVNDMWLQLEDQMPDVFPHIREMSRKGGVIDEAEIRSILQKADPKKNNAYLSTEVPRNMGATFKIIGTAMLPNKFNRKKLWQASFVDAYRVMKKEDGFSPSQAAITAAEIAEMNTARVHFDLSNMLWMEAKHRWFSWFATKHRLYAWYLTKTGLERPMATTGLLRIAEWMEERNDRLYGEEVPEWDRDNLVFRWGGHQRAINLRTLMWLEEYPMESFVGIWAEEIGDWFTNWFTDKDIIPTTEYPFDVTLFRGQEALSAVLELIMSPIGKKYPELLPQATREVGKEAVGGMFGQDIPPSLTIDANDIPEQDWQNYLASLDPETQARYWKSINQYRVTMEANGEGDDLSQACIYAFIGNVGYQFWKALRPLPMRNTDMEQVQAYAEVNEFFRLTFEDPRLAKEYISTHPVAQAALNIEMDPWQKRQRDHGMNELVKLQEKYQAMATSLYDLNPQELYNRAPQMKQDYQAEYRKLIETYPILEPDNIEDERFTMGSQAFFNGLQLWFPMGNMKKISKFNTYQDPDILQLKLDGLESRRNDALGAWGVLQEQDQTTLLARKINRYYDQLIMEAKRGTPYEEIYSTSQQTVAKWLARGGESGPFKMDKYLELVRETHKMELISVGTRYGRASKSQPILGILTATEKAMIGYNSNPEDEQNWMLWAAEQARVTQYQRANGISPVSKLGQKQWDQFEQWSEALAEKNPNWGKEWRWSRLRLDQRMRELGVGTGKDPESQGWREFLQIMEDYWYELDHTWNDSKNKYGVTPQAQAAAEATRDYLGLVIDLAERNPYWMRGMQNSGYTLSKFGFYWRMPGFDDNFLPWDPLREFPLETLELGWSYGPSLPEEVEESLLLQEVAPRVY